MSKESIRSEIRRKEAQVSANKRSIDSLSDRVRELQNIKKKLEDSESDLYQKIKAEKQNANRMRTAHKNIRFIALYSDSLTDSLTGTEANRAKKGLTQAIAEVERKIQQLESQISSLQSQNRSLSSSINSLNSELRRLEREEAHGV